jgi:site-specific recombinase XerD
MASTITTYNPIDAAVADWLEAKSSRSNSKRTAKAYRDTMADFRAALAERGIDLVGPGVDPALVALTAEQWAGSSRIGRQVTPATFNLRLAIVSSFYEYYAKKSVLRGLPVINPVKAVDRHKVQAYARAMPLDSKNVKRALKGIDRQTTQGKRDYALLLILTTTGRRLSEIAAMKRGDLTFGDTITINFPHCKGGKVMSDRLTAKQSAALVEWLHAHYGNDLAGLPNDAPVWISLSKRNPGAALGIQAIADVCQKYLGTSKVHTLRHTFAVMMDEAGASITEIQNRLGHESAATTSIYMERLHAAENPYVSNLDDMLGTGD